MSTALPPKTALSLFEIQDVEALRQEAAATLLQAAQDGSLEAVLKKKTGPKARRPRRPRRPRSTDLLKRT